MTPNPGSPQAIEQGCTCPILENNHGKGVGIVRANGNPLFWFDLCCPLHGHYVPEDNSIDRELDLLEQQILEDRDEHFVKLDKEELSKILNY